MRVAVWHWLIHHAAWAETTHKIGKAEIAVKRGEVCFSQQQIQDETGATRKQVREVLDWLLKHGKASKIGANDRANNGANVRANAKTLLRIEKYEKYQSRKAEGANAWANEGADERPTKEQEKQITTIPVGEADASEPVEVNVVSSAVWNSGKPFLTSKGVKDPGKIIGRWLKTYPPLAVLGAFEAAQKAGTQDPIPYITEALKGKPHGKSSRDGEAMDAAQRAAERYIQRHMDSRSG